MLKANRLNTTNFRNYYWNSSADTNAWLPTSLFDANYAYDNSGNFTTLKRYGNTGGVQDNLSYNYTAGTNRLSSLSGSARATYTYDPNGSVLSDSHRAIGFIIYSPDNLPVTVYMTNGQTLYYENDVFGRRTSTSDASGDYNSYYYGAGGNTEAVCLYPYSANLTYNILGAGGDNIGQVKVANGSVSGRYYYLKDHLGSIRMTVDANGDPVGWDDYYPYGMQMTGRSYTSSADQRYKFTGKERDASTGLDYFRARYYDSWIARWIQVDPSQYKYPDLTPFTYCLDNPLSNFDPDGKDPDPTGISETAIGAAVATGILITATYLVTKNYFEYPSYSNFPKQSNITNTAIAVGVSLFNTVSNWFSSKENIPGKRTQNQLPDKGEPGTVKWNKPGTSAKKYGDNGWIEKEYNKGHQGGKTPDEEKVDHVHDHEPNPYHPEGRPKRQKGRPLNTKDKEDFGIQ